MPQPDIAPFVRVAVEQDDDTDVGLQELQVADYIVFLFALDTYMGWLQEVRGGVSMTDPTLARGLGLLRMAERQNLDAVATFIRSNIVSKASVAVLEAALRPPPTPQGASTRAFKLRTVLSKGGTATTKAVFGTSTKARREVQEAIEASMIDDPDVALNKFSALVLRNKRLEKWIDEASEVVVPGAANLSPVQEATKGATDATAQLLSNRVTQDASPGTDVSVGARDQQASALQKIESDATDAAKKAMAKSGEEDRPLTKAEVIGVATAAAASVASDPDNAQNVPPALRKLDPEQRAAAMTGGKVRVSAGAGSGKSTTLLARTQYLIDQGAVPNRMMAMSFNTKAAEELAQKMAAKIGSDKVHTTKNKNPNGVQVGTMHSTFLKYINQFGTREQVDIFARVNGKGGIVGAGAMFKTVKDIWDECFKNIDKNPPGSSDPDAPTRTLPDGELWKMPPKSKRMMAYLNLFQGQGWSLDQAQKWAADEGTLEAGQAIKFFEVYEGIKGGLGPKWQPNLCGPKPSPKFDKFKDFNRAGKPRVGDFNDMLSVFRDVLKENPAARKKIQEQFDHVMVDECVHEDSLVRTEAGEKTVRDVQPGDVIQSFENGKVTFKPVIDKKLSSRTTGYKIRTTLGYELDMTPEHRLYATAPEIASEGEMYLYLMYRRDLGFRIGISERPARRVGTSNPRAATERADCLWVIDHGSLDEMAYLEQSYSLQYGIPTQVFEGTVHGLNQDRIDRIFATYGENGRKLLEEKELHFDYPNWVNATSSTDRVSRVTINLNAHRAAPLGVKNRYGASAVSFSYTGELSGMDGSANLYSTKGGRKFFTKKSPSYVDARRTAKELAEKTGGRVRDTLFLEGEDCLLVTASALYPGMKVPVLTLAGVVLDRIEEITKSGGTYYDLSIQDSANFFANGVLSHNCQDLNPLQSEVLQLMTEHVETDDPKKSFWMVGDDKQAIYQFRGSDPQNFIDLEKQGFKDRQITTNYRCAPEFVDAANKLIANNKNQIPMEAKAAPNRARGEAQLLVKTPDSPAKAAIEFGKKILAAARAGEALSDFAVLARTNAELAVYQQVCAVTGTKYVQKKASSVFAAQETETFRAFASSTSADPKVVQDSFCQTLMSSGVARPKLSTDRAENAKFADKQMKVALRTYCTKNRIDLNTFDPIDEANRRPAFLEEILVSVGGVPGFAAAEEARNARPIMEGISQIRGYLENPAFTSKDLFEAVLALPVTELVPPEGGSRRWTHKTSTFREATEKRFAAKVAQEEAEEDADLDDTEKSNLGALDFVRLMMEPNEADPSYNPQDPKQFQGRFEGLASRAEELRIDPDVHEKQQAAAGIPLADRVPPPGVYLGTVHSTKGAEWSDVTLLMPKGVFPMERKPHKPKQNELPEETLTPPEQVMEAERRLGYVGLTRAKKSMTVMCPGGVSPFVHEAGLRVGQNVPQPEALTPGAVPAESAEIESDEQQAWDAEAEQEVVRVMEKTAMSFAPAGNFHYSRSAK